MIASRLQRVRAMGREEIAFRARAAARARLDRLAAAAKPPRWNRADLPRVLAPHALDGEARRAVREGRWDAVQHRVEHVFRSRPSRFVFVPETCGGLRAEILRRWPSAADEARARADRIVSGEYDLLGYRGLRFTQGDLAPDWHLDPVSGRRAPGAFWADVPFLDPAVGDHKIIWELNRHQHWLALGRALWLTGDRRYRREIVAQLHSWLAANPPLMGINWASMLELAFRSLSWVSALHVLLASPAPCDGGVASGAASYADRDASAAGGDADGAWMADLLVALHHQLEHVARNLSCYFSPNTHLLGEALALYVTGLSVPEMARSARWSDLGRRVLLEQLDRQIEPDGGHAERSLHYHRYTLDFYLLALLTAERCGDEHGAAHFREAVGRMAAFLRELADDHGRAPLIGDDDGGMLWPITGRDSADVRDSLALASVVLGRPELAPWGLCEETLWLAWSGYRDRLLQDRPSPAAGEDMRISVFPATGYVAARDGAGGHLVFDAGRHGFLNCGHAHADALAMTVAVSGHPLLIDPGTGSYTADPALRDRMRRTANHNTVTVGGRSSSVPAGPFHWRSRTDATLRTAVGNARFGWLEAFHDGYAGLRHRRSIVQAADGWLVVDEVLGGGEGDAHAHWHFDPLWTVARESDQALAARHADGGAAWLLHDASSLRLAYGDAESGLGWCSPRYGAVVPTWSAVLSRSGAFPAALVTWIGAALPGERIPALQSMRAAGAGDTAVSVRLRRESSTSVTVLRPGDVRLAEPRGAGAAEYRTDARLLRYTTNADGTLASLAVADGTCAIPLRDGLIAVAADRAIGNLHIAVRDRALELRTSAPPARLRLEGAALRAVAAVGLNGRTVPVPRRAPDGALDISGGDWPASVVEPGVDLCVA